MKSEIKKIIEESIKTMDSMVKDESLMDGLQEMIGILVNAFNNDRAVYFCGNGGSAADAQHLAAELSGRFKINRKALRAEALHVNTSFITAVANDFCYEHIYVRAVEAFGRKEDVLIAISTSGASANVINATKRANELGLCTIAITGNSDNDLNRIAKHKLMIPSTDTARIQESYMVLGHILCQKVEECLFP